jgi:hypothetical protein
VSDQFDNYFGFRHFRIHFQGIPYRNLIVWKGEKNVSYYTFKGTTKSKYIIPESDIYSSFCKFGFISVVSESDSTCEGDDSSLRVNWDPLMITGEAA